MTSHLLLPLRPLLLWQWAFVEQAEDVTFHLLLPGATSPTSPDEEENKIYVHVCPVCKNKFAPHQDEPGYNFCCRGCESRAASGKRKGKHTGDCTMAALPWSKRRRLRRVMGARTSKEKGRVPKIIGSNPRDQFHNLVAGGRDKDSLFLQLAVYAARDRELSREASEEAFRRFEAKFRKTVGHLNPRMYKEGSRETLERSILFDAWMSVQQSYCLPGSEDEFPHYVRRVISLVKRPRFSPHLEHIDQEDSWDEEEESAESDAAHLKKRANVWTNETFPPPQATAEPSPRRAVAIVGIKERTFYALIEEGAVPAKKQGGEWHLQPGWEEAARQWREKEEARCQRAKFNETCARAWAIKRKIPLNSAKTQIKRWRSKRLGEKEIREKIGRQYIEQAARLLSQ